MSKKQTIVVALGGNAILQPGQLGTFEEQLYNVDSSARRIASLAVAGYKVIVVHGNGPQVGNLLIQNALAAKTVAPMPMDVCGAESQGQLGYLLAQTLENHLRRLRCAKPVACVITEMIVDGNDPGFANPTKPVGPFYDAARARSLMLESGYAMKEDAGRGWRRVVPSPEPVEIVQLPAIRMLVDGGCLVICSGGGGIPVLRGRDAAFSGTAAVIDKDLAAARLALDLGADTLLILTDVANACLDYRGANERALDEVGIGEMQRYIQEGHFRAGSMEPKVRACLRIAAHGGTGIIASLTEAALAIEGKAGTRVVPTRIDMGLGSGADRDAAASLATE